MTKKAAAKKTPGGVKIQKLRLNTLTNTRKTFARILRMYASKKIRSRLFFRDLIYALSRYSEMFKMEISEDLQRRLDDIERRLDQAEQGKGRYVELQETS